MIKRLVSKKEIVGLSSITYTLKRYKEVFGIKKYSNILNEIDKFMLKNEKEFIDYIFTNGSPYVILELEDGNFLLIFCPKDSEIPCQHLGSGITCEACWINTIKTGIKRPKNKFENYCGHKIIILTGVDRCGKSSIWLEINKQTNYRHFIIDRFTEGFLAYKEIYNKEDNLCNPEELKVFEENMKNVPHILIYLDCDPEEIKERCIKTNEPLYNVKKHQEVYKKYFNMSQLNKVILDTTGKTPEECVKELIEHGLI